MSGTPITVATLLGHNVVALLPALCAHLGRRTGLDLQCEPGDGDRPSDDPNAWRHDLLWACGLASLRAIDRSGTDGRDGTERHGGTGKRGGTRASAREHAVPDPAMRTAASTRPVGDIVAAPVFAGERAPRYRSLVVARRDGRVRTLADIANARVAINEGASWSGCHALLEHLLANGLPIDFRAVIHSGSHRRSVAAVAGDSVDCAAIDHSVWTYLERTEPALTRPLRVVVRTADRPAPPFLLGPDLSAPHRALLLDALLSLAPDEVPGIVRVEPADARHYRPLVEAADRQAAIVRAWSLGDGEDRAR